MLVFTLLEGVCRSLGCSVRYSGKWFTLLWQGDSYLQIILSLSKQCLCGHPAAAFSLKIVFHMLDKIVKSLTSRVLKWVGILQQCDKFCLMWTFLQCLTCVEFVLNDHLYEEKKINTRNSISVKTSFTFFFLLMESLNSILVQAHFKMWNLYWNCRRASNFHKSHKFMIFCVS